VFKRGKRFKVWVGRWREDVIDSAGQLKRVRKTEVLGDVKDFPTQKLAMRELESRVAPINSTSYRAMRSATFSQFAEIWSKNVLTQHKPSTQCAMRSQIRTINPYFGKYPLKDISWQTIQGFIQACSHKAPKTCKNHILTLKMIWKAAKAGSYVNHNPFEGIVLPKSRLRLPFFYTIDEAQRILAAAEDPQRMLYWIAAETGLRPGELCGLRIDDVDVQDLTARVAQSVWGGNVQTPKSANAIRQMPISPQLAEHLKVFLSNWRPNPLRLMFATDGGRPWSPMQCRRWLGRLCIKLGIPAKGLKAFRHCNASMMDRANIPMKVRQERLGHAPGSKVTMVHYTHSVSEDDRSAASKIGGMLSGSEMVQ